MGPTVEIIHTHGCKDAFTPCHGSTQGCLPTISHTFNVFDIVEPLLVAFGARARTHKHTHTHARTHTHTHTHTHTFFSGFVFLIRYVCLTLWSFCSLPLA